MQFKIPPTAETLMKIDTQLVHTDLSRSIFIRGGESRFMTYCVKTLRMPWSFEGQDLNNSSCVNSQVGKGAVVSLKVR